MDVGDVIDRKYEVRRVLEVGARGTLLEARERESDRFVWIELFRPFRDAADRDRFLGAQRLVAELSCEHVARVLDSGLRSDGMSYVVTELHEGESLDTSLRRHGPLPLGRVVELMLQLCGVIEEAHAAGVLHGCLGPECLFVTYLPDGSAYLKVRDLGVGGVLISDGQLLGAPRFLAPEQQVKPPRLDARTDIWAIGATMYELSSGRRPGKASGAAETVPLGQLRPGLPWPFVEAVTRCLASEPEERLASAAEIAEAIARFGPSRGHGVASAVRGVLAAGATRLRSSTEAVRQMVRQRKP